ncbi:zf-DHHC-domain-containing protein [Trametes meyenii]|nr:zf-DHHC-domain-containing protein [Trametes meyenii]
MAQNGTAAAPRPEGKCCGVVEEAREKSAARRSKPQPWIVLKLTVFITLGIIGYAFYVYIGRLCVPMIRRDADALGGRGMGVGFLVVFAILGLLMIWAYEKVVLTPPGYARDHVHKSPAPIIRNAFPTWWDTESEAELAAARYGASHPPPEEPRPQSPRRPSHSRSEFNASEIRPSEKRHGSASSKRKASQNGHAPHPPPPPAEEESADIADALPPVAAIRAKTTADRSPASRPQHSRSPSAQQPPSEPEPPMQPQPLPGTGEEPKPMMFTRKPPSTPIMLPEYRYCHKDGFQKPMRAHHCRACGTCVLKYDHHCPWIGQCVGARNHRLFMIFVWWVIWFTAWTFSTLVGLNARAASSRSSFEIDGQQVAVMAFSGLFLLFATALFVSHIDLICNAQTTVESLGVRRMREREQRVLRRIHPWWDFRGKRATKAQWDAEWGRIGKEGNPWWLGSERRNWEATMGAAWWMWILPIGRSPDDGVNYELNPRFDREGRWRPRKEWPRELR